VIAGIATIILLDQLTKSWAVANLADGPKRVFGDTVELVLTRNGGSAFSRFQGITPVLAIGAIIVTIVLARVLRKANDRLLIVALTLLLGGALGNLLDRIFRAPGFLRGHVVDFIRLPDFPVFNVADMAINVAAAVIIVQALRGVTVAGARADDDRAGDRPGNRAGDRPDDRPEPGAEQR
jgi:signal peptidase II